MYGPALKEVIHEEFGDGVVSAIDFTVKVEREPNPAGDRVRLTWSGKFLPYKNFWSILRVHASRDEMDYASIHA